MIALNSAILSPADGATVAAGPVTVSGYAFAGGDRSVQRVDVSTDRGHSWARAELLEDLGRWAWRQWQITLTLEPGEHEILVRAWDSSAATQPEDEAALWNPKGYVNNARPRIRVRAVADRSRGGLAFCFRMSEGERQASSRGSCRYATWPSGLVRVRVADTRVKGEDTVMGEVETELVAAIAAGYAIPEGCLDELLDAGGRPLSHARSLMAALDRLGPEALSAAGHRRDAIFMQQGITFEVAGSDGERRDRAWPLDLVPRVLTSAEWTIIKRGLAQRIRALNAFVDDVYHAHEIVQAGIVPWSLIVSRKEFARPVHGVRAPGGVYCHVCGCDLVRDGDGRWRVLEDNVRTPSGISYVLENRLAMTRLVPELFAGHRVRPVDQYPTLLLDALRAVAPAAENEPTVVLWTPGAMNSAYFEHAFLARQMGVELVEPTDLDRPRRDLLHAHDGRPAARAHDLPAHRRLVHRPAGVPARLAVGGPRPGPRLPRRNGRDRQRDRHRRRRRQGDLLLRAGDDPVLPRPRSRSSRTSRPTCCQTNPNGRTCSAGWSRSSSSRPRSPAARACSSARRRREPSSSSRRG